MVWDILLVCLLGFLALLPGKLKAEHERDLIGAKAAVTAFVHLSKGGDVGIGDLLLSCEATRVTGENGRLDDSITLYY